MGASILILNKKGSSVQDLFLTLVVIFVLVIAGIVANIAMKGINDELQINDDIPTPVKVTLQEKTNSLPVVLDSILLMFIIGMGIALVFGAALLPTHPVFFIFIVMFLAIIIAVSAGLSNAYADFTDNPEVSDVTNNMTVLPFVMTQFPKIMLFLGVLLFIGLYAKTKQNDGGAI